MGSKLKGDLVNNLRENNYFTPASDIVDKDINNDIDSIELLINLCQQTNSFYGKQAAIEDIKKFLEFKKYSNSSFMYSYQLNFKDRSNVIRNTFNDEGSGIQISGTEKEYTKEELSKRGKFDFRITLRNSNEITDEEAIAFIKTLVSEANDRKLNLRAKNYWEQDAFILYCDMNDLGGTVKLLNDLANNKKYGELVNSATKHFGEKQPFSVAPNANSYYGIAMAHCELPYNQKPMFLSTTYGQAVDTFNGYIDTALNTVYSQLSNKYNNDKTKINAEEMWRELNNYHKKYMVGNEASNSNIPLWMNGRNYKELKENIAEKTNNNTINNSVNLEGRGR